MLGNLAACSPNPRVQPNNRMTREDRSFDRQSVAATDPPGYRAATAVLFLDGDVSTILAIGTVAPVTGSVTPPFLIGPFAIRLPALAPTLTALIFLLLRVTNTDLRAAVRTDAELKCRLSH